MIIFELSLSMFALGASVNKLLLARCRSTSAKLFLRQSKRNNISNNIVIAYKKDYRERRLIVKPTVRLSTFHYLATYHLLLPQHAHTKYNFRKRDWWGPCQIIFPLNGVKGHENEKISIFLKVLLLMLGNPPWEFFPLIKKMSSVLLPPSYSLCVVFFYTSA